MALITSTDQLGTALQINFPPQRIVSLVPSQTELLFDLGLDEEVVGITRFCIHPADKVKTKQKIGGTKQFDIEKIKRLAPDLIIGNKEENYQEGIEELQKYFPIWMSDVYTLEDSYAMIREVSRITNRQAEGERMVTEIKDSFHQFILQNSTLKTAAYFIWRKPYMVAAKNTFINHLLEISGMKNVFANETRYPEINPEILTKLKPDFIFLSSEPYRFTENHFEEFRSFSPASKVFLVDGEMFSWYGSRLRYSAKYFQELRKQIELL